MWYSKPLSSTEGDLGMNYPDGFDLDTLLAPFEGDLPHGIDVREDFSAQSPYSRLRDARSNARDAERQAEAPDPDGPQPPDPGPLWRGLRELGLKVLTETTKDIEIAAWITEAYVRSHGLIGLAAGVRLITGLSEQYWDALYPMPDDYGMETRVAPVTGLNGQDGNGSLRQPLFQLKLFERADGSGVALYKYRASALLPTLDAERRQQRIDSGAIPFDELERDARTSGVRTLTVLREEATEALEAWETMTALLDEKAGADSPSTSHVRDLLREVIEIAGRYVGPANAGLEGGFDAGSSSAGGGPTGVGGGVVMGGVATFAVPPGALSNREDALRALENIATFFRKTEPQSPLSYTLDEAVRRGRMSWPDLMKEIIADRDSRNAVLTSLGIRPSTEEEDQA
jgi:type VI secretion system protein ImpA